MRRNSAGLLVMALMIGVACKSEAPTGLVVSVATDLRIPEEVDQLEMTVTQGDVKLLDRLYSLAPPGAERAGSHSLPATLSLQGGRDLTTPVNIEAVAKRGDTVVVRRVAELRLIHGRVLLLRLALRRSCRNTACPEQQTCAEAGCQPVAIDPASLPDYRPEDALAGLDVGVDVRTDRGVPREDGAVDRSSAVDSGDHHLDAGADSTAPFMPTWVTIPAGSFWMGSPEDEPCRALYCEMRHQVTLTRSFEISAYPVTKPEFKALMGYEPLLISFCAGSCPVDAATWHQAAAYCNALSAPSERCYLCSGTGKDTTCAFDSSWETPNRCPGYRLPTEAEWEYAYRAGTQSGLYNGELSEASCTGCSPLDPNADAIAWYCANYHTGASVLTHPVGQKKPNAWGLYDMAGNVRHWVNDWYLCDLGPAPATDPTGGPASNDNGAVLKGGCYANSAHELRAASRIGSALGSPLAGFRCVRSKLP